MRFVSVDAMRELDRRTIEDHGVAGEILMDRAGLGVATIILRTLQRSLLPSPLVRLVAGRGNNGGDVFVAARYLADMGVPVEVWLAADPAALKGDARIHFDRMRTILPDSSLRIAPSESSWHPALQSIPCGLVVDGLLGTGTRGAPRGVMAEAIRSINKWGRDALVLAVDIPSGLNADTGEAPGDVVRADITVSMALPKQGFAFPKAREYVGHLHIIDIGIPPTYVAEAGLEKSTEFISAADVALQLPRRVCSSHKGTYGHVLLLGGARGFSGAIAMAARAALRTGAGLVSVWTPGCVAAVSAGAVPEAMFHPIPETGSGSVAFEGWMERAEEIGNFDAVLVGPGMTRHKDTRRIVEDLLSWSKCPVVMDADALNVFEGQPEALKEACSPRILTPHPGELARLLGVGTAELQSDRVSAVLRAAEQTLATVVLKGAGTLVAELGRPVSLNLTGNPGMATGGSGDVLGGMLVSLLGQGLDPYDAACVAVYLHGTAGDYASWQSSQAGMIAGDIISQVPFVLRDVIGL